MSEIYYISSLVARVEPDNLANIRSLIEQISFAEVPSYSDNGKMVVLIDAPSMKELLAATDQIRDLKGVYSLLPVYQHEETNQHQKITDKLEIAQ